MQAPAAGWGRGGRFMPLALSCGALLIVLGTFATSVVAAEDRGTSADIIAVVASAEPVCSGKDPHEHVYHPDRLKLIESCLTINGVVREKRGEPDGDYHIQIRLDPGQGDLLNAQNRAHQKNSLVIEIVCAKKATQKDAKPSCAHYTNPILIPRKGDHVSVTGPYIEDLQKPGHGWREIHPVWELSLTPTPPRQPKP